MMNSSSTLKCPEVTGRKKGRVKETEMEANSEDGARAGAGSGVGSGVVVKALPFPEAVTSRIRSSFSKHQPETTLTDGPGLAPE